MEIAALLANKETFQFVDMSDDELGRDLPFPTIQIPFTELEKHIHLIDKNKPTIIGCKFGEKSFFTTYELQTKFKFNNLQSLTGGIENLKNALKQSKILTIENISTLFVEKL